jgi:beta-mannosidase
MKRLTTMIAGLAMLLASAALALDRSGARELTEFQFCPLDRSSGKEVGEWLPAQVPGDVISDLERNGKVPDPFHDLNSLQVQWVNNRDWLYRSDFQFQPHPGRRAYLLFMGVDYRSRISLNGKLLAEHEGMFSRIGPLDITDLLVPDGSNRLEVKMFGIPDRWLEKVGPKLIQSSELGRRDTLKTQMSYGWDFAPRLKGAGIWDRVYLYETGPVAIRDLFIEPHLDGRIDVAVELKEPPEADGTIEIDVAGENFSIKPIRECIALQKGRTAYRLNLTVPEPRLWWPWEMGEQNLYRATATVAAFTDRWLNSDSVSEVFGVREISWAPNPDAPPNSADWVLQVNGRRVFMRGGNWVPAEALNGRLTDERYRKLVTLAREANLNLLRVWGGGNRERSAFYDACDRAGIMVWQEFPLACVYILGYPRNRHFLDLVHQEAGEIVRQLRNHPSLIMWCGGNEWNVKKSPRVAQALEQEASALDPTRRFVPASPYRGDSHNWIVWHQYGNLTDYFNDRSPLPSEFGLQAYPAAATLRQYLSPELVWPIGEAHRHHDLGPEKMAKYSAPLRPADNLESVVEASQVMQAHYLQRGIEFWRQRKYRTSGVAFWQFNEPWPAICWSVLDYDLRPKLAYTQLKDTLNPLLVSAQFEDKAWQPGENFQGHVILVNDFPRAFAGLTVKARAGDQALTFSADLPADGVLDLGELQLKLPASGPLVLELTAEQAGRVLAKNRYDLSVCDPVPASRQALAAWKLGFRLMSGAKPEQSKR